MNIHYKKDYPSSLRVKITNYAVIYNHIFGIFQGYIVHLDNIGNIYNALL